MAGAGGAASGFDTRQITPPMRCGVESRHRWVVAGRSGAQMSKLQDLITEVIEREGGYVNHPDDRGGATKFGITLKTLRAWRNDPSLTAKDVEALQAVEARAIYESEYWYRPGFHKVSPISERVADELLDTGVNQGSGAAVKHLQRILTAFNNRGAYYPDLKVDGVLGTKTLSALASYLAQRGLKGEKVLLFCLDALQAERYVALAERDERQESFCYGQILNRAAAAWVN